MSSVLPPPKKNLKQRRKAIIALEEKTTIKREGLGFISSFFFLEKNGFKPCVRKEKVRVRLPPWRVEKMRPAPTAY